MVAASRKAAAIALIAAHSAKRNLDLGSFSFIGQRDGKVVAELSNGKLFELFTIESIRGKDGQDGMSIAGRDGKNGRGIQTITQPDDSQLDIELTDGQRLRFALPKGEKGEPGRDGKDGTAGPRGERGAIGAAGRDGIGIQGEKGQKGDTGPAPDHEWRGTELRFRNPDGSWGKWVDLKGQPGRDGRKSVIVGSGSSSQGGGSGNQSYPTLTAGQAISQFKLVTTNDAGLAIYADSANATHQDQVIGIARQAAGENETFEVQDTGLIENPEWTWTTGKPLFVARDGEISQDAFSGVFVQQIGFAKSPTEMAVRLGISVLRA